LRLHLAWRFTGENQGEDQKSNSREFWVHVSPSGAAVPDPSDGPKWRDQICDV
jgi:hypothetical protein